ncbi:MAG TPA: type IV pilin [Methanoregulaceae archaeon]|jgi:hypothetical protein|nr:type IV pilin [Methanoregulaceae archaeon]
MSDNHTGAISEIVGALILTSLITLVIGIIAVGFLSQGTPAYVPAVRIDLIQVGSDDLVLIHRGGDTLHRETTRIYVNGIDRTIQFQREDDPGTWTTWNVGERLVYNGTYTSVRIVYSGSDAPALLFTNE